ncbi:MAG: T9SS type A sorting domain-containing protein, partial [Chitinophagales bacterium]
ISQPIIFTSEKPAGERKRGDWGGLILLGYAPVNWPGDTGHIEGIVANPDTRYGGGANPNCGNGDCPDANDNSGVLQYVRIEFAGIAFAPNNEINGLTLGGVGDGTIIDHVQVSYSNDDSYEWFGGTVNCKHLISFRGLDDDFDTDNGYAGHIQFAVSLRDPNVADVSGSKGFESDNDPTGTTNEPQTSPVFCNVDAIAGADTTSNSLFIAAAHLRRNSHQFIYNSILLGWPEGLLIDGTATQDNVSADTLIDHNLITSKSASNYVVTASPADATSVIDLLKTGAHNNYYSGNAGVMLTDPYNLNNPDFQPQSGSPALYSASFAHAALNDPFIEQVTYKGAFDGVNDWTSTWANWDPVNTNYISGIFSLPENVYGTDVFPNPAKESIQFRIQSEQYADVKINVMDLTGKIISETRLTLTAGVNSIVFDVSSILPGIYTVQVLNTQTLEQGISKFVKD